MEFLEVLRRWMWIFFRVETEWGSSPFLITVECLANRLTVRNSRGPAPDDILLGEFSGNKLDED